MWSLELLYGYIWPCNDWYLLVEFLFREVFGLYIVIDVWFATKFLVGLPLLIYSWIDPQDALVPLGLFKSSLKPNFTATT